MFFSASLFARLAGLQLVHVPYKGIGNALPDMMAGRVQVMSTSLASARPYLKNNQIRALATGAKRRLAGLPDVPTSAEAGLPGWEMSAWFGIFAANSVVGLIGAEPPLQTAIVDSRPAGANVRIGNPLPNSS